MRYPTAAQITAAAIADLAAPALPLDASTRPDVWECDCHGLCWVREDIVIYGEDGAFQCPIPHEYATTTSLPGFIRH